MKGMGLVSLVGAGRVSRFLLMAVFVAAIAGCSSSPTTPTPAPTPTPDPDPPTLTCPSPVAASTTGTGTIVTFAAPAVAAGKEPVTVACTPASGSTFALGTTAVSCTATDALNRTSSCSFNVTVSKTPQLTATKFLAFGDSITAGEVSFPVAGILPQRGGLGNFLLRVVPSASYPTVLAGLLTARYTAQSSSITVVNDGVSGERARDAATMTRFQQALSTHRPDVVLLMHGYNDIIDPTVITATVSAVDAMMAEARNRRIGRVVVLNLAPPRPGGNNSRPASTIDAFNERLQRAASGEGALQVDIHSALSPAVSTYIGIDGLHPNEAGYRKIAETVLAAIRSNLEVR